MAPPLSSTIFQKRFFLMDVFGKTASSFDWFSHRVSPDSLWRNDFARLNLARPISPCVKFVLCKVHTVNYIKARFLIGLHPYQLHRYFSINDRRPATVEQPARLGNVTVCHKVNGWPYQPGSGHFATCKRFSSNRYRTITQHCYRMMCRVNFNFGLIKNGKVSIFWWC